jgi:hypothetical protein
MKEIKCIQGSDEWFEARLGLLTGSHFQELMPSERAKKEWTDGQLSYLRRVAAEILTGQREETYQSPAMVWGTTWEPVAREAYSDLTMTSIRECGFFQYSEYVGSSPDGIIGKDASTFECKCPASKQHLRYFLDPAELWKDYKWQVVGEMLCTGIHEAVIVSYDPRFPEIKQLAVYHPKDYADDLKKLEDRLGKATEILKEWIA